MSNAEMPRGATVAETEATEAASLRDALPVCAACGDDRVTADGALRPTSTLCPACARATVSERVAWAVGRTPHGYLMATCALHGPSVSMTREQFAAWLMKTAWEPYDHPAVQAPARAFRASCAGLGDARMTVVRVDALAPATRVRFDDPSEKTAATGVVMGTAVGCPLGARVGHVVALLGPSELADGAEILWTAHAGDPIAPSRLPASEWAGRECSAAEALAAGVTWVRCGR